MNKTVVLTGVVALIIGLGAGYFGGNALHRAPQGQRVGGGSFPMGGRGGMMGGLLTGTVAAKDATSITINTRDGSSHVVLLTSGTTVSRSVSGSESDISVGSTVLVTGTANSDGSISATLVQLALPALRHLVP